VAEKGHRTMPHTADLRIEAWPESREECLTEALRGLIGCFAQSRGTPVLRVTELPVMADNHADVLASAVDEIIYLLDADREIPISVQARPVSGGVVLVFALAAADAVEITGAVPKAVSLHGVSCEPDAAGRWSASMTVHV